VRSCSFAELSATNNQMAEESREARTNINWGLVAVSVTVACQVGRLLCTYGDLRAQDVKLGGLLLELLLHRGNV